MTNTSKSLGDKLEMNEKVLCEKCGKGYLIPYNPNAKINHSYKCTHCDNIVHFVPNVIVK